MPMPGVTDRTKAGRCSCAEGYVAVFSEDRYAIERFVPNNLNAHDCEYIRRRNSMIPHAEKLARQTGVPFLKAMDFLMWEPSAEEVIRSHMKELEKRMSEVRQAIGEDAT